MKADRSMVRFGDAIIYLLLVLLCVFLFLLPVLQKQASSVSAAVVANGELLETVALSSLDQSLVREINGCRIEFSNAGVRFVDADCPDKLCVKTGEIRLAGESIACVPNRVVVTLRQSDAAYDVVAY